MASIYRDISSQISLGLPPLHISKSDAVCEIWIDLVDREADCRTDAAFGRSGRDIQGHPKAIPGPSQGHWSVNLWATPNQLLRMKAGPKACARHVLACGMFEKDGANQRRFQRI